MNFVYKQYITFLILAVLFLAVLSFPKIGILNSQALSQIFNFQTLQKILASYNILSSKTQIENSDNAEPGVIYDGEERTYNIVDNRNNPDEPYMFKLDEGTGDVVEIGEKASGLPGYKLTNTSDRVFFKLNFAGFRAEPDTQYQIPHSTYSIRNTDPILVRLHKNIVWFIYPEISIKYTVQKGKVKADYVLSSKPKSSVLDFNLDYTSRLVIGKNPPGYISAYSLTDGEGSSPFFEILQPNVIDAQGKEGKVTLEIKKIQNTTYPPSRQAGKISGTNLSITIDNDFLETAAYPITIDPTSIATDAAVDATQISGGRKLFKDSKGNLFALYEDSGSDIRVDWSTDGSTWNTGGELAATADFIAGAIDSENRLHITFTNNDQRDDIHYTVASPSYTGGSTPTSWDMGANLAIQLGASNNEVRRSTVFIMHDDFPAIMWNNRSGGGNKDAGVRFSRCDSSISGGQLACDDAIGNWCNVQNSNCDPGAVGAGCVNTGCNQLIELNASNVEFASTLAQVPSGANTEANALYAFWARSGGAGLAYINATCNNCSASPPTWNAWGTITTPDSSNVSSTRYTYIDSKVDYTNSKIVYVWGSGNTASTHCNLASGLCLLSKFRDFFDSAGAGDGPTELIGAASTTESDVDAQPSITHVTAKTNYYVALKNSSGNTTQRSITASYSSSNDWSSPFTVDSDSGNTWPQFASGSIDGIYAQTTNELWYADFGSPVYTQRAYIFQNDDADGDPNNNSDAAPANTALSNVKIGQRFIIRFQVDLKEAAASATNFMIEYDENDSNFREVRIASGAFEPFPLFSFGDTASKSLTTNKAGTCTSGTTFQNGEIVTQSNVIDTFNLGKDKCTEFAFGI
ncbi:hypothetical protein MYX65_10695, partial [Acidobacteria bacterium AH-259-L09]|nr:hypothetical protein [Acidobacteria bacterium AH-259-L09]